MANSLGFLIWGEGEPLYLPQGETGCFVDGNRVTLIHETEGFNFDSDIFTVEMTLNNKIVGHSFKTNTFAGSAAILIVDPSETDATPCFTDKFLIELCSLPEGDFKLEINFKVNNITINQGFLTYQSDGIHKQFKVLTELFKDVAGARAKANSAYQQELEEQQIHEESENQKRGAATKFQITINNQATGYTCYIISVSHIGSEEIFEVTPGNSVFIDLFRGQSYQLKYFYQYETKDNARFIVSVDEYSENKLINV